MTKNALAAGARPGPAVQLTALPPPDHIAGLRGGEGKEEQEGGGGERKGKGIGGEGSDAVVEILQKSLNHYEGKQNWVRKIDEIRPMTGINIAVSKSHGRRTTTVLVFSRIFF